MGWQAEATAKIGGGLQEKCSDGGSERLRRECNGDGDRPGGAGNGDL